MKFNVFDIRNKQWSDTLDLIPASHKDVNFLSGWYQSWSSHEENAEALCLNFIYGDYIFLYPFFRKKIKDYDLATEYYDIQSAYGYGGVIVNRSDIPQEIADKFNKYVTEWLHDNRVIAEFIRVHPLLSYFKRNVEYIPVRKNILINTSSEYKIPDKHARQNISKAIASNCTIVYDENCEYMNEFADLYLLTAERLRVRSFYKFSPEYFSLVKSLLKKYTVLIHILKDDTIVASGLLFKHHEKGNLHLTASKVEYQILRANDLLYYATIQYSIDNQIKVLNVGGGLGNKPDDSLLRFKSKFSNNLTDIYIGKNILNKAVFDKITKTWELRHPELVLKYCNYFLKYHQEA